ncbi:MAG: preprotein translocase subunit SecE [Acidimicrobiia bacterium]
MNRETRRMIEREERLQKNKEKSEGGRGPAGRASRAAAAKVPAGGGTAGGGAQPVAEKQNLFRRIVEYLHEVRVELRKVSWPTSEQLIVFTAVTMITSVALTLLIFGLDFGLKTVVLWIIDGGISG